MMKYKDAIKNHRHLKALGQMEVYLSDDSEKPWQHVTSCEAGGSHRLDMATSVWFRAIDPKTKIKFRWTFELESSDANGKGHYEIDRLGAVAVFQKLQGAARKQFANYLADCAAKVRAKGEEWKACADRQFNDAGVLESLAASAKNH